MPHTPPDSARVKLHEALAVLGILIIPGLLHLIHPNLAANKYQVHLFGPFNYAYNEDSSNFVVSVVNFPYRLETEEGKFRRTRPLYSFLGWIIYQPLKPCAALIPRNLEDQAVARIVRNNSIDQFMVSLRQSPSFRDEVRKVMLAWTALIIVNFLIYWTSLVLVYYALIATFPRFLSFALVALLATHFDIVDFILVPHTEPFNILIPALFLWALRIWLKQKDAIIPAGVLGLVMLGKGMPYPLLNWLYEFGLVRSGTKHLKKLFVIVTLVLAPLGLYLLILRAMSIQPYSAETTEYRQFVWIWDYWHQGRAGQIVWHLFSKLRTHMAQTFEGFFIPFIGMTLLLLQRQHKAFLLSKHLRSHLLVYTAGCAAFWCFSGFIAARLTITQFPVVLYLLGWSVATRSRRPQLWLIALVVLNILARAIGLFDFGEPNTGPSLL